MTIGISIDQEICLILGQVSLSLTSRRIYVVQGETDKTASDIQARALDEIGKKCLAEREAKMVK